MNIEITLERSEILSRNLIRSAIATLCWQRQIFPDICFEDKVMAGLTVKRFRSVESFSPLTPYHPLQLSNRVRAWIEDGAFDALRKRYLDSIIFGICHTNKEEFNGLIETYTIKIDYNDTSFDNSFLCSSSQIDNPSFNNDGLFLSSQNPPSYSQSSLYSPNPSCSQSSLFTQSQSSQSSSQPGSSHLCTIPCVRVASYETVKAATVQMLKSVTACTQAMRRSPLPQQCCVTMKLLYKDSVTPPNYQPKHFMPLSIKNNNFLFSFDEFECDESPMGVVETDYHSVRVSIETPKAKMCVNNSNNNKCRKVCYDNSCDDLVYSNEETAALLDKRDRILFAMDVLNDLPRDKRTRKITRVELRDIMGMSSAEVSELLFALTDLKSLRGTYGPKKNVFELSTPKNTYWTSNPDEITLPILKEIFNKYEKRFINNNNNGCNGYNVCNDMFTCIKKRKARDIEIPILKTKGKYI